MNVLPIESQVRNGASLAVRVLPLALLLFATAAAASAQTLRDVRLDQPIETGSRITFKTLVQQVLPDVTTDGKAGTTGYVRDGWLVTDASVYTGRFDLVKLDAAWVNTPAGRRMVLFLKLEGESNPTFAWGELALLAVFRTFPEPKLLDLVDVGGNRTTTFYGTIPFQRNADAVIVEYEFRNPQDLEYRHFSPLQISDDGVRALFGEFPYLVYGQSGQTELSEYGEFSTLLTGHSTHREIIFTINTAVSTYAGDELTIVRRISKTFRLRAVWRHGRYRFADGGAARRQLIEMRRQAGFDR